MKDCLTCNNKVPEGRVVSKCNGCLAMHRYGNALDEILDLVDGSSGLSNYVVRSRVQRIAINAVKAVPDRTPNMEVVDEAQD